ncbi:MAG: hypothetical protein QOF09_4542, partial [Alphaproteobacteria bacterium]|nr:hypothetical protein [Alphaproteobacteria bacterium]
QVSWAMEPQHYDDQQARRAAQMAATGRAN